MKHSIKFLTVLVAVFCFTILTTYAQQGINYKAIISDNGAVLQNQTVQVQFSVLRDGTTLEYQETHSTTTDANGIIILNIGEGTAVSGLYNSIHWYASQFLKVEIDTGSGYVDFGTTEFKTVPYAIYAENGDGAKTINDLTDAKKDVTSIFLGNEAGSVDDGNTDNTAVGNFALRANTTGTSNNAIGFAALHNNVTGSANIANGATSLAYNTSGSNNIAIGVDALTENITGSNNTALGRNAGYNSFGNNNIFLGYEAGYNETGSNKLYIENSNSVTPLIGGDFSTDEVTINGSIAIIDGTQGAGKILISDANGKASWVVPVTGATELNDLSDAISDGSSIFIGTEAGVNDDNTNNYNTGIGTNALYTNTMGQDNTAIGYNSLYNTTGVSNTANGSFSLFANSTGQDNTAIGAFSLIANTEGNSNTANGYKALNVNTIGSSNTISGYNSFRNNIIGDNNTAIGSASGYNATGSGNVFIGSEAGYNETGDNKLYIENSNSATPLIGGDFSTDEVTINGSIAIVDGTEGVDKVLTSDVNGKASWVVPVTGAVILNDLTDAKTGGYSTFIGYGTGVNDDGSSNDNTGIGYEALHTNTTGYNNVANGVYSLYNNTIGSENVANGNRSLRDNTTGSFNVAYGDRSLQNNTIGGSNTANGYNSLQNNITGSNNTVIGYQSGYNAIGTGNIFLGNSSGYNETGDNKLYIENTDSATPLIGGDFSTDEVTINGTLNVTGNITANLTGDVTGNVIGNITGDVTGNITGDVNGRIMAANSGTADMKAYIYGSLYSSGGLKTGPSSNGFTSAKVATGHYRITFDTNLGSEEAYLLIASVSNTSLPQIITYYQSSSYFDIYVWDMSGNNVDAIFNFVVYKK